MKKCLLRIWILVVGLVMSSQPYSVLAQAGSVDTTFIVGANMGADNGSVADILQQPDGKILVAGNFTSFNGDTSLKWMVRLNLDGSVDPSFNSPGIDNHGLNTIALQTDGKILIGGGFNSIEGNTHKKLARLNSDGSYDPTFDPGNGFSLNLSDSAGQVIDILYRPGTGSILVGGQFRYFNGSSNINHITRLTNTGSLDPTFNAGLGTDTTSTATVWSMAFMTDTTIIIGGNFHRYNGNVAEGVAKLSEDGVFDSAFTAAFDDFEGADGRVEDLIRDGNNRILIGGRFAEVDEIPHSRVAFLKADGDVHSSNIFNSGIGFQGGSGPTTVSTIARQTDGKYILGGNYSTYNGNSSPNLVRIQDYISGPPSIIGGSQDQTFVTGTGPNSAVYDVAVQDDGRILIGGIFTLYDGTQVNRIARLYPCSLNQPDSIVGQASVNNCVEYTYSVNPVAGADSYVWTIPSGWSGTSTTNSITVVPDLTGGEISVKAFSDSCGFSESMTLQVGQSQELWAEICFVSVDTVTYDHNVVYWEWPVSNAVDSVCVHWLDSTEYVKMGAVHRDSLSVFHDGPEHDPNTNAHRYKLSTKDTCGNESPLSASHQTIHFQHLVDGNLQWTKYLVEEDSTVVSSYVILRDTLGNSEPESIGTLNSNLPGTFTDPDWNNTVNYGYHLEVIWDGNLSCDLSREVVDGSRSNKDSAYAVPDTIDGIGSYDLSSIEIYPNPASNMVFIKLDGSVGTPSISVRNLLGKNVSHSIGQSVSKKRIELDVAKLPDGIYLVSVVDEGVMRNGKLVIKRSE